MSDDEFPVAGEGGEKYSALHPEMPDGAMRKGTGRGGRGFWPNRVDRHPDEPDEWARVRASGSTPTPAFSFLTVDAYIHNQTWIYLTCCEGFCTKDDGAVASRNTHSCSL